MDYKTLTDEQLQTERQNIMDEIARRNDLADIPKQAEEMALRFEALGGSKSDLAQIDSIQNSVSYVSGTYTVALYKELARFPVTTLGVAAERDFLNQLPSLPRVYDGAALYFLVGSGAATPANSAFSGHLDFVYN